MNKQIVSLVAIAIAGLPALSAQAYDYKSGDMLVRVGVGTVDPKSDNSDIASVDSGTTLVFNGTYMFNANVGVELLAALPFSHDIKLVSDGTKVGETKHLPPTLSMQYHFPNQSKFTPYVGAGINYTLFFSEETAGVLAGSDLDLDSSFGLAAQAGFDVDISDNMFLNVDLRWMDIDTDVELDGAALATVEIDPIVYSVTLGWRF